VFVDGVRHGVTPRNIRNLSFGAHIVRVAKTGYASQERTIPLTNATPTLRVDFPLRKTQAAALVAPAPAAGGSVRAPAAQQPAALPTDKGSAAEAGALVFETRPPGAEIWLDEKRIGVTPFTLDKVAPGKHAIELRLAGFHPWFTSITVDAGARQRVTASLERDTSR